MTKLKSIRLNDEYWLVAVTSTGQQYWLHRQGKVGDCIRPGQRRDR